MNNFVLSEMNNEDVQSVNDILAFYDLTYSNNFDYTVVLKHHNKIIGTCSFEQDVIKAFAIKKCYHNSTASKEIITHILNKLFDRGVFTAKVYTPSSNKKLFKEMQFKCIYDTGIISLLITGENDLEDYLSEVNLKLNSHLDRAAIVMNCNPFTLGHLSIIETASKECDELIVFVVEENQSVFPFDVRFELVKKGVEHLKNVSVIRSGPYMVSLMTFPDYFIRKLTSKAIAAAELDAGIFASIIAKRLNITKRFVGTEPYCDMTSEYNNILSEILPKFGIDLRLMHRFKVNNNAVSASKVRRYLSQKDWIKVKALVPVSTYNYLQSLEATEVLKKLEEGDV